LILEIRHAWRAITKMPVVAMVIVASLSVGIGVNAAVFSWMEAVILRPLPGVPDASGFYAVETRAETGSNPGVSWPEFHDLSERVRSFPELLAFRPTPLSVGEAGRTRRGYGLLVSSNYFSTLQLRPAVGRFFRPDEASTPGREPVVVVSHEYWQNQLGGAADVVGQIDSHQRQSPDDRWRRAGTVPGNRDQPQFRSVRASDVGAGAVPRVARARGSQRARLHRARTAAGRARGAGSDRARSRDARAGTPVSGDQRDDARAVTAFWNATRGPQRMLAGAVVMLQGILLALLLAVCANTANLLLARVSVRHREMGVRLALGASRWRIVRLLLVEHIMLATVAALLGAAIAAWASNALRAVPIITAFPVKFQTGLDGVGLVFTLGLGVVCGVIFGIGPALQLAGVDPQAALHSGARSAGKSALRNTLMGIEVGLALVVLVVAALFLRSFSETRDTDPGFKREGVLLAAYEFAGRNVDGPSRATSRGACWSAPGRCRTWSRRRSPSRCRSTSTACRCGRSRWKAASGAVPPRDGADEHGDAGLLRTMGIPFRTGRDFADLGDERAAGAGDRQRGIRAPVPRRRRADRPASRQPRHRIHHRRRGAQFIERLVQRRGRRRSSICPTAIGRGAR
jgi:predicted permease